MSPDTSCVPPRDQVTVFQIRNPPRRGACAWVLHLDEGRGEVRTAKEPLLRTSIERERARTVASDSTVAGPIPWKRAQTLGTTERYCQSSITHIRWSGEICSHPIVSRSTVRTSPTYLAMPLCTPPSHCFGAPNVHEDESRAPDTVCPCQPAPKSGVKPSECLPPVEVAQHDVGFALGNCAN